MGKGLCSTCSVILTVENSIPSVATRGAGYCRSCYNVYRIEFRKLDRVSNAPEAQRGYYLSWAYGTTQEDFDSQFEKQKGLCAICKVPMVRGTKRIDRVCQDHDHTTGKLRELLCARCNILLSNCLEDEEILVSAIRYLQKHANGGSIKTVCEGVSEINSTSP
jgi:hypothetical protein